MDRARQRDQLAEDRAEWLRAELQACYSRLSIGERGCMDTGAPLPTGGPDRANEWRGKEQVETTHCEPNGWRR